MDINKAKKIADITNEISLCEEKINSLDRTYKDEFTLNYRGIEMEELEEEDIELLINRYKNRLEKAKEKLKNI